MKKVAIWVTPETKANLIKIRGALTAKTGKNQSMITVQELLIELYILNKLDGLTYEVQDVEKLWKSLFELPKNPVLIESVT